MLPETLREPLREVRHRLTDLYGERLLRVVLYGSQARGEARPDSDVDVLVVLDGPVEPYTEIKRMADLKMKLFDQYGLYVSLQPYAEAAVEDLRRPFMQQIRAEGIDL